MDRHTALKLLGLNQKASSFDIEEAFQRKTQIIADRMNASASTAGREECLAELSRLRQAREAAYDGLGGSLDETGAINEADLPTAAPGSAISDEYIEMSPEKSRIETGRILARKYEITGLILEMESGPLYDAFTQNGLGKVTIKIINSPLVKEAGGFEKFVEQARIISGINHPNVMRIHDFVRDGNVYFFVAEPIQGETLRRLMDRRKAARKPFTLEGVQQVRNGLCDGLTHIHQTTFHLDIKPENLWLSPDGSVKIMDFGLGRLIPTPPGPVEYMAPEQVHSPGDADELADQFSFGAILYEMLTGRTPAVEPPPIRDVRKDIPYFTSKAIDKAMSSKPTRRHQNVAAFCRALSFSSKITNRVIWGALGVIVLAALIATQSIWFGKIASVSWVDRNLLNRTYWNQIQEGKKLLADKKWVEAEQKFEAALQSKPEGPEATLDLQEARYQNLVYQAEKLSKEKRFNEAEKRYRDAERVAPKAELKGKLADLEFERAMDQAKTARDLRKFDLEVQALRTAQGLQRDNPDIPKRLLTALFDKHKSDGDMAIAERRWREAYAAYEQARKLRENDTQLLAQISKVVVAYVADILNTVAGEIAANVKAPEARAQWDRTLLLCDEALKLDPRSTKAASFKKGIQLWQQGKKDDAYKLWDYGMKSK